MKMTNSKSCPLTDMVTYSMGDCAVSLVMNSLFGFAMMYYTDALGLKPSLAGVAMFLAFIWDGITDPVMGHLTDNTRSRFGKRHPYMLIGGLGLIISFYFLWMVPGVFKENMTVLFWYLVVVNLLVRTFYTIFNIPFTALGFQICTDYVGRTRLQGVRNILGMATNLCGPALSWLIFFGNNEVTRATNKPANYVNMGTSFAIAASIFFIIVLFSTMKYMKDSRDIKITGNSVKGFAIDMKEIILDRYPRWAFAFVFIVILGIGLVGTFQIYLYEHFLKLEGAQKTIAHGGTMVGMALGAAMASRLVKHFDKKKSIAMAAIWGVFCNIILAILFLPGWLKPDHAITFFGINIPIVFMAFVFFHSSYWLGNGIMLPISMSMMADVSEINEIKTGINKDGGYSAVYTFIANFAGGIASLFTGYALTMIGYVEGTEQTQSFEFGWRLCTLTFIVGPFVSLIALAFIMKYPVTESLLGKIRSQKQESANITLDNEV
jgi:glycoside/pentoside/hexuronide:cation symporter, GPH family